MKRVSKEGTVIAMGSSTYVWTQMLTSSCIPLKGLDKVIAQTIVFIHTERAREREREPKSGDFWDMEKMSTI